MDVPAKAFRKGRGVESYYSGDDSEAWKDSLFTYCFDGKKTFSVEENREGSLCVKLGVGEDKVSVPLTILLDIPFGEGTEIKKGDQVSFFPSRELQSLITLENMSPAERKKTEQLKKMMQEREEFNNNLFRGWRESGDKYGCYYALGEDGYILGIAKEVGVDGISQLFADLKKDENISNIILFKREEGK
ncbi:hypothetical protein A2316_01520 [Candidatus Falkowbacteria bacterium RIFOXYB2_FULL_38_15]|uniref:Uncharacterized protein n=1 Tax=Candidatus Falkowbacteria bacterium RIFOXYA2_FULL_38_12 TaxID=1797993 RepID=A0A1F5S1B2_9BACT|nr:MAG: hypothetical protein A2257_03950 [Candidatus Falkowbacteria bacterium RIFOXYA2_FULL_38_12]OGF32916.1 MAG: hypothetical protein A2316_01520 [Candidatus Falkowbacteria bacterium RIFOXYB2_FULL_38_15]OGF44130.1 MAG: hypothetical protein A2555_01945 [Candidatus Falkowbacteria bacterium RIFOXYD2_FULL_39_16]